MRKILLPILLLRAAAAFAQPVISAEVASDPVAFQVTPTAIAVPAIAMARDRIGVAAAWTMQERNGDDRISVARLDATGHFIGTTVRSLPVGSSDPIEAISPSLAPLPGGTGFTLAWLEVRPTDARSAQAFYCSLDADLKPSLPFPLPTPVGAPTSPAIVRSGKTTWITANHYVWQIRENGSINGPLDAGTAASDMTVATTDVPQIVGRQAISVDTHTCGQAPGCVTGGFFRVCTCPIFRNEYSLQFTAMFTASGEKTLDFESSAAPSIRGDGRDVIVAWFQGTQRFGGNVVAVRITPAHFADFPSVTENVSVLGTFGPDSDPTRPDIATDGERYVVVWRSATADGWHDILGASIDRAGNVVPFSIATAVTDDERDPSIVAVSHGRFLVAYDKWSESQRRLAGRFVTFPSRLRAVR